MRDASSQARVWAALLAVYVVWGSTYLGIDVAIRTIPPFLMASFRFLLAGAVLYAWSLRRGDRAGDRPGLRQWLAAAGVGVPMLAVGNAAVAWGEQTLDTGLASLLIASVPLWLAVLDRAVYRRRLHRTAVVGLGVGFAGVALLVGPGGGSGDRRAALVLVLGALAWAGGSLYSRHAPLPRRPLVGASMQMLAGGAVLLAVGGAAGEYGRLTVPSWESWAGLAYLVTAGSLVGYTTYVWLLRNAATSLVGTYAYVNPVVAVLLGTALLGEPLTWETALGGGVILGAVALIVAAPRRGEATAGPSGKRPAAVPARGR